MSDDAPTSDELAALEMIQEASKPVVTKDWKRALKPKDGTYSVYVATGQEDEQGRPELLEVELVDRDDPTLLVAYMASEGGGPGILALYKPKAARSLAEAVVRAPHEITKPEVWDDLPGGFKMSLTFKILKFLRIEDFLQIVEDATKMEVRTASRWSTKSPTGTDSTLDTSDVPSRAPTSSTPTPKPDDSVPESAKSSSKTSDTLSETPSPKTESSTPTNESPTSAKGSSIRITGSSTGRTS